MPTFRNTLFHLHRRVGVELYTYPSMNMEQTECSETSAYKIQTLGNFICRRFETLCMFHLHRRVGVKFYTYPSMNMEQIVCSETSAYKIQTPGNFICRRFETLCLFHLHRRGRCRILHLSAYEDGTECSETSAHNIQTSGNYPAESIKQILYPLQNITSQTG